MNTVSQAEAIQGWLIDRLAEILEIEPNQIDVAQDFEEYGLESAEAINLSGDLEDYLRRRLPPTLLWDYQNIESLAQYLASGNLPTEQVQTEELPSIADPDSDDTDRIYQLKTISSIGFPNIKSYWLKENR